MSHPSTSLSPHVVVGLDVHVERITLVVSRALGQVDSLTLPGIAAQNRHSL